MSGELKYSFNIIWSDEDECYVATSPELPGLSAFGETQEAALHEATIAAHGIVRIMRDDREQIPNHRVYKSFSGQSRIRIPKSLHRDLSLEAEQEDMSLNSYIVYLLTKRHTEFSLKREISYLKNSIAQVNINNQRAVETDVQNLLADFGVASS